jgi:hypothetical protein
VDASRLVSLDETGASTNMTRARGRAPRGRRPVAAVPHGHRKVTTLTAAFRLDGVGACLASDGATDATSLGDFVGRMLAPAPRPGDIVIMDDPPAHKVAAVGAAIRAVGAEVRHLPAYSPELSPIEKDQTDSTSSDRWCEATGAGYDRRRRVA